MRRSPAFTAVGWIPDLPSRVQAPTLIIRGALDDQAPEHATRALYDALGGPKAYVTVSCGSHELVYEIQHTKLLRASAEWLRFGTVDPVVVAPGFSLVVAPGFSLVGESRCVFDC